MKASSKKSIDHGKIFKEGERVSAQRGQIDLEELIKQMQRDLKRNGIEQD